MAHRVLAPSSPYTQPDPSPSTSSGGYLLATRPASPTKVPIPLPHFTASNTLQQEQGKENNSRYSHPPTALSPPTPNTAYSIQSPTAPISSPKLSYTVAAAPPPTFYSSSRPSPASTSSSSAASAVPHYNNNNNNMHYHRPTGHTQAYSTAEPTMTQLLANQPSGIGQSYASRMQDRDSTMANATGVVSRRKGQGFKEWEKVRLNSAEVKRKADVAQLCQLPSWTLGAELRLAAPALR